MVLTYFSNEPVLVRILTTDLQSAIDSSSLSRSALVNLSFKWYAVYCQLFVLTVKDCVISSKRCVLLNYYLLSFLPIIALVCPIQM